MVVLMGPVMDSALLMNASSFVSPLSTKREYRLSAMPCTAPSRIPRSPKMSDLYSLSSVVSKV